MKSFPWLADSCILRSKTRKQGTCSIDFMATGKFFRYMKINSSPFFTSIHISSCFYTLTLFTHYTALHYLLYFLLRIRPEDFETMRAAIHLTLGPSTTCQHMVRRSVIQWFTKPPQHCVHFILRCYTSTKNRHSQPLSNNDPFHLARNPQENLRTPENPYGHQWQSGRNQLTWITEDHRKWWTQFRAVMISVRRRKWDGSRRAHWTHIGL